uniref:Uncharacterized protein n=1 Tax=Siphoviridae sp. ctMgg26 TaxID=2825462 RepID=A0A8S5PZY0_9CAUD|nr:MAG TPA: hypothetical protein [Siphoviridae sp. ctMgg26]
MRLLSDYQTTMVYDCQTTFEKWLSTFIFPTGILQSFLRCKLYNVITHVYYICA